MHYMTTSMMLKEHRKSMLGNGTQATFEAPLLHVKSFVGQYTTSTGDIKKGRMIEGIASTENKDQQGEVVIQQNMDCSYLLEKGFLNWNHSHAPEDQIGKPLEVNKVPGGPDTPNQLPCTFFRSMLFDGMPRSEAVWALSKALEESAGVGSNRFLGFSVEGGVRVRHGNILMETLVRHMAATHEPVNAEAVARCVLAKSQGFVVPDGVLIDTLDNNVPHFVFKSFGDLAKSLLGISPDLEEEIEEKRNYLEKNIATSDAPALMLENLSRGKRKHTRLRKSIIESLYDPCIHGNDCFYDGQFRKGLQGALDHLVYCGGIPPLEAAEALTTHIRLLKSSRI